MRIDTDELVDRIRDAIRETGISNALVVTLLHEDACPAMGNDVRLIDCICGEVEFLVEFCEVEYNDCPDGAMVH